MRFVCLPFVATATTSPLSVTALPVESSTCKHLNAVRVGDNALILLVAVICDDLVFLCDERGKIELHRSRAKPRIARVAGIMENSRGLDEILARQTTAVDAGSSKRPHLRQGCGFPRLRRSHGSCKRR